MCCVLLRKCVVIATVVCASLFPGSPDVKLSTDFLTHSEVGRGDTWTARIRAESTAANRPAHFSLILYIYNEGDGEMSFRGSRERGPVEEIFGITPNVSSGRKATTPC